ncbi:MAG: inositol monophosphatase family protein [Dehalococcoidia bacterium]
MIVVLHLEGVPPSVSGRDPIAVAQECAARAGRIIRQGFGRSGVVGVKGRGNVVSEVDFAVERACAAILAREYPSFVILGEETASTVRSGGWMWVIDPLDGTRNFTRNIPHFCFTLALCHGGQPLLGLTLQPLLGETFLAATGGGAWLNGERLHVDQAATLANAIVAVDLGYDLGRGARTLDLARQLWPRVQAIRVPGSAALDAAYLAAGRWDLYVHSNLQPWDIAAAIVLVREAGAEILDRDGSPATIESEAVVAGAPSILHEFHQVARDLPWKA